MECQHVDPDGAWQIHKDVDAYNSIGVHWGTFKFSHEVYCWSVLGNNLHCSLLAITEKSAGCLL